MVVPNYEVTPITGVEDRKKLLELLEKGVDLRAQAEPEFERLRYTYQTSLWLMSTELCDVPLHQIHRRVCDFFVHKDPKKPIELQGADEEDVVIRDRMLLYPRHGWKTTIDALDAVNWIICFPLIQIAIQTGDGDLAKSIVGLIKSYFVVPGWNGLRDSNKQPIWNPEAEPTKFHRLFPEHCTKEVDKGAEDFFNTPARNNRKFNPTARYIKDPTVYALSIESNTAGWRCQVMKNDDILTDNNIRTSPRVSAIDERYHSSHNLLPKWGYRDTIGTRYDSDETYGRQLRKMGFLEDALYSERVNKEHKFKCLCLPAWWLKGTGEDGEGELRCKFLPPSLDTPKDCCEFLDEEIWDYESLRGIMFQNRKNHASQYLNNPVAASESSWTREGMLKTFVDWQKVPPYGKMYAIVDLAYSVKKGRDYTVIAVGKWYNDALWIIDIIRGRFKDEDMGEMIVGVVRDYPEIIELGIEDSVGAKWLKTDIFQTAEKQGVILPHIEWISLGQGSAENSKDNRIEGLVPLYKSGRFFILNNVRTDQEEIINEFISTRGKRDIPDAISRLRNYQGQEISQEEKQEEISKRQQMREQDMHDQILVRANMHMWSGPLPHKSPILSLK